MARGVRALVVLVVLLAGCSGSTAPSPSPTSRPIFSGTQTEYAQAMAACMQKKGIAARFRLDESGVPGVEYPAGSPERGRQADAVAEECAAKLPVTPEPTTEADFRVMYENRIAQTRCVQEAGYDTPQIPSWQSFLQDARSTDLDWDPTGLVPVQLRNSVRRSCVDQDKWW